MKNRRSFLKMLGLGAVTAPAVAKLAFEAEAAPISGMEVMLKYRAEREKIERLIELKRRIEWHRARMMETFVNVRPIEVIPEQARHV